jgi:uncharacterized membrane protein
VSESDAPTDAATTETSRPQRRKKSLNILSVVSLVAALVASPLAVVFGYVAVAQIRRSDQRGASMAWTAVGLGWLWVALYIVVGVSLFTIWRENPFWP